MEKKDRLYTFRAKVCKSNQDWGYMLIVVGFENKAYTININYATKCGMVLNRIYDITCTLVEARDKKGKEHTNIGKIIRVH